MYYRIMKNWYRGLRNYFFPRQKWLLKKIPNDWRDKDSIFEIVLSESIIDYVEKEKCFEVLNWETRPDEKEAAKTIKEIYNWFMIGEKELQERIDILMEELYGRESGDFHISRDESKTSLLYKLEEELYNTNTKYMVWLIEHRSILWA